MKFCNIIPFLFIAFLSFLACKKEPLAPKPIGYFKMDFPTQTGIELFTMNQCNFTFLYPNYVVVEQDTLFFDEKPDDPCWLNIKYPMLNAIIHMSYKSLYKHNIVQLTEDYHKMKNKHVVKADYIDDLIIENADEKVYGLLSSVGGDVASAYQFYITDSSKNFVRGSLYFNTEPNADSLKPAVEFVRDDILSMLESWKWQ